MWRRFLPSLIMVCLLTFSILPGRVEAEKRTVPSRPQYWIDATYDDQKQSVRAHMKVRLPKEHKNQHEIYFHLYPNAFRHWRFGKVSKPTRPGSIELSNVKFNGQPVQPKIRETIMKIDLPRVLHQGKSALIEMDFHLHLPKGGTRLNVYRQTAFLAQWYPMLAVKDRGGWHTEPYTTTGDPFYSIVSDFDVTFHLPKNYQVISTAVDQRKPKQTVHLKQEMVRDFVAVLTKDYRVHRQRIDGIMVNLWSMEGMDDTVKPLLRAATSSMQFYNQRFGHYPYPEVDVVLGETGYGIAGMEYPGLITSIPKIPTSQGERPAVNVVAHELAHQWWYGVVGNNQAKEPWLDEGLTTFSEFLYMREKMKEDEREIMQRVIDKTDEVHRMVGLTSAEPLYHYPDNVYGLMVYLRPAAMLFDLMYQVGEPKMMKILSTYYKTYQYRVATTQDFIRIASQVTGKDLQPFFQWWLYFKK